MGLIGVLLKMKIKILKATLLSLALTISGVVQAGLILELSFDKEASDNINDGFSGVGTIEFDGSTGSVNIIDLDMIVTMFGESLIFTDIVGTAVLGIDGTVLSWIFEQDFEPISDEQWSIRSLQGYPTNGPNIAGGCTITDTTVCSVTDSSYGTSTGVSFSTINVPEPSTFAIFALGMIGLASRRFKKQS